MCEIYLLKEVYKEAWCNVQFFIICVLKAQLDGGGGWKVHGYYVSNTLEMFTWCGKVGIMVLSNWAFYSSCLESQMKCLKWILFKLCKNSKALKQQRHLSFTEIINKEFFSLWNFHWSILFSLCKLGFLKG